MSTANVPTLKKQDPKEAAASVKIKFSILPTPALIRAAQVLQYGADKYGKYNWRKDGRKQNATTYTDAAARHIAAYNAGERIDPDSGLSHLAHACAGLMILIDAEEQGTCIFDMDCNHVSADMLQTHTSKGQ